MDETPFAVDAPIDERMRMVVEVGALANEQRVSTVRARSHSPVRTNLHARAREHGAVTGSGTCGRPFPRDHPWDFAASPALPRFTSCCATRTFPSRIYFNRRTNFNPKKGRHASASNFPELCNSDGLRHHPSEYRVFARVSGNVGTTTGLHARRLAAMRRADPRCG